MVTMLANALTAVTETSYVGRLDVPTLAGMALVFPGFMMMQMLSGGAIGAATALATLSRVHDLELKGMKRMQALGG